MISLISFLINILRLNLNQDNNLEEIKEWLYRDVQLLRHLKFIQKKDLSKYRIVLLTGQDEELLRLPALHFLAEADALLKVINEESAGPLSFPVIFKDKIYCTLKKESSPDKTDIPIFLHDQRTKLCNDTRSNIKLRRRGKSTLIKACAGTNFIYRIEFPEGVEVDCDEFNASTYEGKPNKIAYRLEEITRRGGSITFDHVQSDCLSQNLRTIDGDLPYILSQLLLIKYRLNRGTWKKFIEILTEENPLNFRIDEHGQVYEYKVKRFLQDCAMGMTPEKPWTGFYDATGGQIIVKKDGDIVCYHVYELNRFLQYLLDATKLEQASTSEDPDNPGHVRIPAGSRPKPYQFGWLYKEDGKYFFKINLQVRFK